MPSPRSACPTRLNQQQARVKARAFSRFAHEAAVTNAPQTLAHLQTYFDTISALHVFVGTTGAPRTPAGFFMGNAKIARKPTFEYVHPDTTFSNHAVLTMRPLLRTAQKAWTAFVKNARACSPTIASSNVACIQRLFHDGVDPNAPIAEQPLMVFVANDRISFDTVAAYVRHVERILQADAALASPS